MAKVSNPSKYELGTELGSSLVSDGYTWKNYPVLRFMAFSHSTLLLRGC
jgi:hypothetical protein